MQWLRRRNTQISQASPSFSNEPGGHGARLMAMNSWGRILGRLRGIMRAFAKAAVLAAAVMIGATPPAFSEATNPPPPVISSLGTPTPPHAHGTAIAGAIAANSKLVGVAPK